MKVLKHHLWPFCSKLFNQLKGSGQCMSGGRNITCVSELDVYFLLLMILRYHACFSCTLPITGSLGLFVHFFCLGQVDRKRDCFTSSFMDNMEKYGEMKLRGPIRLWRAVSLLCQAGVHWKSWVVCSFFFVWVKLTERGIASPLHLWIIWKSMERWN